MTAGYQIASALAPPVYTAFVLARRGRASFSVNRLLRATWIAGLGGAAASGAVSYAWYSKCSDDSLRLRRLKVAYDTDRVRAEDHATIGAILMSVLTPALLWKQASTVNLVLGGAGLGTGMGLLTHHVRTLTGDPPPKIEAPIIPVVE
ncbi:hypothetical protein LshimejAT787_0207160 [Lyophyllum shimeji]|uniref:Uncharacterized protein n=1 Tax=Lyophyllum shimeji TaxID=47721 RepID=A0A9P3PFY9_LYOSH|nr:hypothetical protein LshimejAT787_0207160 [Lyophyllum shimeji]